MAPDLEYAVAVIAFSLAIPAAAGLAAAWQWLRKRGTGPRSGEETRAGSVASRE